MGSHGLRNGPYGNGVSFRAPYFALGKESFSFVFGMIMLKKRLEVKRAMQADAFLIYYLNFAAGILARR